MKRSICSAMERSSPRWCCPALPSSCSPSSCPSVFSAYFSLTDWAGFGQVSHDRPGELQGRSFTADPVFWRSLLNALILMVVTVFIQNPAAFALAAVSGPPVGAVLPGPSHRLFCSRRPVPRRDHQAVGQYLQPHLRDPQQGPASPSGSRRRHSWLSNPHTALWGGDLDHHLAGVRLGAPVLLHGPHDGAHGDRGSGARGRRRLAPGLRPGHHPVHVPRHLGGPGHRRHLLPASRWR